MAAKWVETLTGSLEQKKQYKQYKARIDALPEPYGSVAKALQRYFMYYGGVTDGETALTMLGDFADLWERAAADGTPVRDIVGGRAGGYERALSGARDAAVEDMIAAARELGADGVVGVDFDYEVLGENNGMMMVAVSGTAVKMA